MNHKNTNVTGCYLLASVFAAEGIWLHFILFVFFLVAAKWCPMELCIKTCNLKLPRLSRATRFLLWCLKYQ